MRYSLSCCLTFSSNRRLEHVRYRIVRRMPDNQQNRRLQSGCSINGHSSATYRAISTAAPGTIAPAESCPAIAAVQLFEVPRQSGSASWVSVSRQLMIRWSTPLQLQYLKIIPSADLPRASRGLIQLRDAQNHTLTITKNDFVKPFTNGLEGPCLPPQW